MLRGYLLRSRATCLLQMHDTVSGLAAAQSAAHLFRSPEVPRSRRYLGWENIADLGYHLWRAGQTTLSIELMREGIGLLVYYAIVYPLGRILGREVPFPSKLGQMSDAQYKNPRNTGYTIFVVCSPKKAAFQMTATGSPTALASLALAEHSTPRFGRSGQGGRILRPSPRRWAMEPAEAHALAWVLCFLH